VNEVSIAGRIVSDPAIRQARTGLRYATLRLAVNRVHPTKEPFQVVVVAFGRRADDTATLHAGDLVRVDGRLGQREWTADDAPASGPNGSSPTSSGPLRPPPPARRSPHEGRHHDWWSQRQDDDPLLTSLAMNDF